MSDFENELRVRAAPADDKGARIDAYPSGFLDEREDVIACIGAGEDNSRTQKHLQDGRRCF